VSHQTEDDRQKALVDALADAHAMEKQSLTTLEAALRIAGDPQLESLYRGHVAETHRHIELLEARLEAHDASRSFLKDLGGRVSALTLGAGVVAQKNTPAKLVAVAYGYENFEVASYELLRRIAERAGDAETVEAVDRILVNERQAVEKLGASFDLALQAAGAVEGGETLSSTESLHPGEGG
jgi:ferritin-like metal-binding protein YciE